MAGAQDKPDRSGKNKARQGLPAGLSVTAAARLKTMQRSGVAVLGVKIAQKKVTTIGKRR
jgi:hypothetical protein